MVMMWEQVFNLIAAATGIFALYITLRNVIFMQIHSLQPFITDGGMVSVLIPARNEEDKIARCIRSLARQTYSNYEIIVLDDQSTDGTGRILMALEDEFDCLRVIRGKPLPDGWYGKNHALHQLAANAEGEILLFTDADTIHSEESISFAVTNLAYHKVDFLSGYPKQRFSGKATAAVLSLLFLNLLFFTPVWRQRRHSLPAFALALGQYLCIRKSAYDAVGGYAAIPRVLTDDIHMARLLNSRGYRQVFLKVHHVVACDMYATFGEAVRGITKCIFDFFDKKTGLLLLLVSLFFVFVIIPTLTFLYLLLAAPFSISLLLYAGISLLLSAWTTVLLYNRFPVVIALLYPVSFLIALWMLIRGVFATKSDRGFIWKSRIVK